MAAAALGNIISDVAGVGLAHYVELLVARFGFRYPNLTPSQVFNFYYLKLLTFFNFRWNQNEFDLR